MITYPVDIINSRWAVWNTVLLTLSRNKLWPRKDGEEIQGADPDDVWMLDVEHLLPDHAEYVAPPEYDARLYTSTVTNTMDLENNRLDVSWQLTAKLNSEKSEAVAREEELQFTRHMKIDTFVLRTAFVLGILINFTVDGQPIPAKWQSYVEKYRDMVKNKLLPNRELLEDMYAEIDAGSDLDIDAGWTEPDPELNPDPVPPSDVSPVSKSHPA